MDSEITFQEFKNYYSSLIERLNLGYSGFDLQKCLKARFICSIVKANADARAARDKGNAKAFKKMSAKCGFWMEAIDYRLKNEGVTSDGIEKAMAEINAEMESRPEKDSTREMDSNQELE